MYLHQSRKKKGKKKIAKEVKLAYDEQEYIKDRWGVVVPVCKVHYVSTTSKFCFCYMTRLCVTTFYASCIGQHKNILLSYLVLSGSYRLISNKHVKYQINQVKHNGALIEPVSERKIKLFGKDYVPSDHTSLHSSSPADLLDFSCAAFPRKTQGVLDSRTFDVDAWFRSVIKFGKVPTKEVEWYRTGAQFFYGAHSRSHYLEVYVRGK